MECVQDPLAVSLILTPAHPLISHHMPVKMKTAATVFEWIWFAVPSLSSQISTPTTNAGSPFVSFLRASFLVFFLSGARPAFWGNRIVALDILKTFLTQLPPKEPVVFSRTGFLHRDMLVELLPTRELTLKRVPDLSPFSSYPYLSPQTCLSLHFSV